jgi:hypothetical protein
MNERDRLVEAMAPLEGKFREMAEGYAKLERDLKRSGQKLPCKYGTEVKLTMAELRAYVEAFDAAKRAQESA